MNLFSFDEPLSFFKSVHRNGASSVAQWVKNLPAMQETQEVQF